MEKEVFTSSTQNNYMKKNICFFVCALALTLGFVACNDDDDPKDPEIDPVLSLPGTYTGWTWGSNAYAAFIPSEGDALTIELTNVAGTRCNLHYVSPTWGDAVITDVAISTNDTAYIFSKPIEAVLRDDRSGWDFSAPVDSVAMPNRNPSADAPIVSNYPIVLTSGFMNFKLDNWQVDFTAYLVPRSGHTMNMSFRDGHIEAPAEE